mgnify:CR=1 FL=1
MDKKDMKTELNENNLENVSGGGEVKFLRNTSKNDEKGARYIAKATFNGKPVTGYFKDMDVAKVWVKNFEQDDIELLESGHLYF